MSLRTLDLKDEYRTGRDNALTDFFQRCFPAAKRYDRAVGYFSSSALESFAAPFSHFVRFGGAIRLITSVELTQPDIEAIAQGQAREQVCEHRILEIIEREFGEGSVSDGVRKLAALLETGRLELQVAMPVSGSGIYHEKVGIFHDEKGEFVTFSGSTNESTTALNHNYECIDVFRSWSEVKRATAKRDHFEALWTRRSPGVLVVQFSEAARRRLIRAVGISESSPKQAIDPRRLWTHQEAALKEFLEHKRGILEMATGTGKTRTTLAILEKLVNSGKISTIIVTCDGNDLLNQWSTELATLLSNFPRRFRLLRHFHTHAQRDEFLASPAQSALLCSRKALHEVVFKLPPGIQNQAIIVQDEVHKFGSASHVANLDGRLDAFPYRLGLSATPEREYDVIGNAFIERNLGPIIYRFSLAEAIKAGILCEFDYVSLTWAATKDDRGKVQQLHRLRASLAARSTPMSDDEFYQRVAHVYKVSPAKVPVLSQYLQQHPEVLNRCIVFLAEVAYAELVYERIHSLTAAFHAYFSDEDSSVLAAFARGDLDCIITCHKVAEGIDIQDLRTVILMASDRARLETIQRIGRCLRRDPANPAKRATVIDFVRRRSKSTDPPTGDEEREIWLRSISESRRIGA